MTVAYKFSSRISKHKMSFEQNIVGKILLVWYRPKNSLFEDLTAKYCSIQYFTVLIYKNFDNPDFAIIFLDDSKPIERAEIFLSDLKIKEDIPSRDTYSVFSPTTQENERERERERNQKSYKRKIW